MTTRVAIEREKATAFCERWNIIEFSRFGSVLRDDFRPDSDVDVLVTFAPNARWGLLDLIAMEDELSAIFGRKVDLLTRSAVERSDNWIRRRAILSTAERIV